MVFDRTENEPEERDPEEEYYDSDSDGLTIPQVSGDGSPDDLDDLSSAIEPPEVEMEVTDAPDDLLQTFWALVLVINAAVLAASLGLLFLVFEGVTTTAIALLVAGVVLFGFAGRRYRRFQADGSDAVTDDGDSGSGPPPDDAAETTSRSAAQQQPLNDDDS